MKDFLNSSIRVLDGAMGTLLIANGMPAGVCPEAWACEHLDLVTRMHRAYFDAGADTVFAFTFGANFLKLAEYGLEERTEEINHALVRAAKAAANGRPVGGDISPTGRLMAPIGDLTREQAFNCYARQAKALAEAGADYLIIETMLDISETREAVLAAKSVCNLPIWVSMTYDEAGYTLTGTDVETAVVTLAACGASAIGTNCGVGPEAMEQIVRRIAAVSPVPVFAKPNAGLPGGKTLPPREFAELTARLVAVGASAVGGCCGTEPDSVLFLKDLCKGLMQHGERPALPRAVTGSGRLVSFEEGFCPIGERINPTGKKKLQAALRAGDFDTPLAMAFEQIDAGARVLDVNVGMNGIKEAELLPALVRYLAERVSVPLCIDTADTAALRAALAVYPGRALINSISAEPGRAEAVFPLMQQYGAMAILLPIDETGVPATAQARIAIADRLIAKAAEYGLSKDRFIIDALAMTVASDPAAAQEALKVVDWCKAQGLLSTMGVSNISFGLPERPAVNAAFIAAARARGMQTAIMNIAEPTVQTTHAALEALLNGGAAAYAARYTETEGRPGITGAVIEGDRLRARTLTAQALGAGTQAQALVDQTVAGLDEIGVAFAEKKVFLPQLMAAAETAQTVFEMLAPHLSKQESRSRGTVVAATVKGDIHDIGKNLVVCMLRNHGFRVIDLGRDVDNETIWKTADRENAALVVLSALLTTTMEQMRAYMALNAQRPRPVLVGGAAVSKGFADEIGALYALDAAQAVEQARAVTQA